MGLRDRIQAVVVALLFAMTGLIGSPAPAAAAAHAVPWRFTTVTQTGGSIGGLAYKDFFLYCPSGYIPVSGGVVGGSVAAALQIMEEWPDSTDGTFHALLYNTSFTNSTVDLAVNCVWLDDVGIIYYREGHFSRNGSGNAGGTVYCGNNLTVLSAGVAWDVGGYRSIYFSSPITSGTQYGAGWYAAGHISTSGATLGVELRCVDASLLTSEYTELADSNVGPANSGATAVCNTGYRILTGGSAPRPDLQDPGTYQGFSTSGPLDYRQYAAFGREEAGVIMRSTALCVPSSTVSAHVTDGPPDPSTTNSGSISFDAADSAGETALPKCYLDGVLGACSSLGTYDFGPLIDGTHTFTVTITNQYGSFAYDSYVWTIDATAPVISSHSPTSGLGLTAPVTITFSEPVSGVTTSSLIVHAEAANVDIAGTVARPTSTTATWTPKSRLVPGETYRFSFTSAIHDTAGNAMIATFFTVRAKTIIENDSTALLEYWDLDTSTLASGGSYISSNLSGSRADLTFTATAGQTVALYGIRLPSGGYADVYLDGVKKATPSFYASTAARVRVYLSGALTAGTHTISIRPLGTKPSASSGTWVGVDNALIGTSTVKQESSFRQFFRRTTDASAYGGSYDVMTHKIDTDSAPRFQVTVVGTGLKLYATKTATSGSVKVYVDGVLKATVNLYAASTAYKALVYSGTFAAGVHVVKLVAVGTSTGTNSTVNLDRISVT